MKNNKLASNQDAPSVVDGASKPRAKFTDEFKRAAVARLHESGTNATLLAIELGIRRNQLYKWEKALKSLRPEQQLRTPGRPPASQDSEIARLQRELDAAQLQVTILKKFNAYLTRQKK